MWCWGQLIAGPPGSGKTTYCAALHEHLNASGRPTIIVNLDPANENLPYEPTINVWDLISLPDVMEAYGLGPNGGLLFCIEFLEANLDWLQEQLAPFIRDGYYILFDCPGQAELYTVHEGFSRIVAAVCKWGLRLVAVHLVDSHQCSDPAKFISAALVSLQAMVRLELPHLNVLSKVDIQENFSGAAGAGGGGGRRRRRPRSSGYEGEEDGYGDSSSGEEEGGGGAAGSGLTVEDFTEFLDLRRMLPAAEEDEEEDEDGEGVGGGEAGRADGARDADSSGDGSAADATRRAEERMRLAGAPDTRVGGAPPPVPTRVPGAGLVLSRRQLAACAPRTASFLRRFRVLNERLVELLEDFSLVGFTPLSVRQPHTLLAVLAAADKAIGFVPIACPAHEKEKKRKAGAASAGAAPAGSGAAGGRGGSGSGDWTDGEDDDDERAGGAASRRDPRSFVAAAEALRPRAAGSGGAPGRGGVVEAEDSEDELDALLAQAGAAGSRPAVTVLRKPPVVRSTLPAPSKPG